MKSIHRWHGIVFAFFVTATAQAQTPRIDPAGIAGSLLLCGAGDVSEAAFDRFIDLAGGAKAKVAVVVVDNEKAGVVVRAGLAKSAKKKEAAEPRLIGWSDAKAALPELTGAWLITKHKNRSWLAAVKVHPLRDECTALLKRSGVIATSGLTSEIIGEHGLMLLPGDVCDVRTSSEEQKKRAFDGLLAFEVKFGAALLLKGRTLSAVGEGSTLIHLAASKSLPARTITLEGKAKEDLTALRRAAFDRLNNYPPAKVDAPVVEKGTLVIVGGGGVPTKDTQKFNSELRKKFVEYAGGEGKAVIAIFATAANVTPLPNRESIAEGFRKAGAKKATVLYDMKLSDVESKRSLDALTEATGLWFDGGRQWNFVDCYENTKALPLMFDVLQRGGVIGGSSAGATIQGEYLCRGGVYSNFDIRYEGYERGLGFIKGVAIDQHFSEKKRQVNMTSLMKLYPQYLGIGIDESTAIVVKGSIAEVIGVGKVHFYDAKLKIEKGDPDYEALSAGGRYELKERKVLKDGR